MHLFYPPRRVLVTGSRDFPDQTFVFAKLNEFFADPYGILIHGNCPTGADYYAHQWAQRQRDVYEIALDAKWDNFSPRRLAGHHRNAVMISLDPNLVVAFYAKGSANKGTQDCVDRAEAAGIEVRKFEL